MKIKRVKHKIRISLQKKGKGGVNSDDKNKNVIRKKIVISKINGRIEQLKDNTAKKTISSENILNVSVEKAEEIKKEEYEFPEIFCREKEVYQIKQFLESSNPILNVIGSPGTGKTYTLTQIFKNTPHEYVNYLQTKKNKFKLTGPVLIIDEFDKFYENEKSGCRLFLKKLQRKLITISNNLAFTQNVLLFDYTSDQTLQIIKKLAEEKNYIIPPEVLRYVAHSPTYKSDIRKGFKYLEGLILLNGSVTITDLIQKEQKHEGNIHTKIIEEILVLEPENLYGEYYSTCKKLKVPPHSKLEFEMILETMEI